jgi:hypothetical protein
MAFSRRSIFGALLAAPLLACRRHQPPRPKYVTAAGEFDTDIMSRFAADFSSPLEGLCKDGEEVRLKEIEGGYAGQITRPLQQFEIKPSRYNPFGATSYREEAPHPIDIKVFNIHPDERFTYYGNLTLYDDAADLKEFLLAVDRKPYKKGIFTPSLGLLGGLLANNPDTLSMSIGGGKVEMKSDRLVVECMGDEGNLYGSSGGGILRFGTLPAGKHELMFYAIDQRGNRSFAVTSYEI